MSFISKNPMSSVVWDKMTVDICKIIFLATVREQKCTRLLLVYISNSFYFFSEYFTSLKA